MLEIDGSRYSGSGTIVRQAIAFVSLKGTDVHMFKVRVRRPKPGLRRQHVQAVESIRQLVGGASDGVVLGSRKGIFLPGKPTGTSLFRIPRVSDPIQSSAWLSGEFLGAKTRIAGNKLAVKGIGFKA